MTMGSVGFGTKPPCGSAQQANASATHGDSSPRRSSNSSNSSSCSLCVGCGGVITDPYILRVHPDLEWHARCLKCVECAAELNEARTCYVRDGKTYCKTDYCRLFANRCAKCEGTFSKTEFVMRARSKIYHIDCFRCVTCARQLIPGEEFAVRNDSLFCRADFDALEFGKLPCSPQPGNDSEGNNNSSKVQNNNIQDQDMECRDGQDEDSRSPSANSETPSNSEKTPTGSGGKRKGPVKDSKTTRVRTVLNEKQLHTLRTCYAANPRPDALMKEQLVEMTGLSPRVIRVWFQNKRCKDKKKQILIKQMEHQQQKRSLNGVPMIATSPVRHEPHLSTQPVDVQSFSASSWGPLPPVGGADPQLQGLEPPAFQQLVTAYHTLYPSDEEDDSCVSLPDAESCLYGGPR